MLFNTWIRTVTTIGALLAYILTFLKIVEYLKKRPRIAITLQQESFSSERGNKYDSDETVLELEADIRNKGLEPTDIAEILLLSEIPELNNQSFKIWRIQSSHPEQAKKLHLSKNSREKVRLELRVYKYLPPDVQSVKAQVVFKTTHKDVVKEIRLVRKDTPH